MKNRVRRRALFAWLPRAFLIMAALLAPVIDGEREPEAPTASGTEVVEEGVDAEQDA